MAKDFTLQPDSCNQESGPSERAMVGRDKTDIEKRLDASEIRVFELEKIVVDERLERNRMQEAFNYENQQRQKHFAFACGQYEEELNRKSSHSTKQLVYINQLENSLRIIRRTSNDVEVLLLVDTTLRNSENKILDERGAVAVNHS